MKKLLRITAIKTPAPDFICLGVYRKVSVGKIGADASIEWEYKTFQGWKVASSEEEAKRLCALPNIVY